MFSFRRKVGAAAGQLVAARQEPAGLDPLPEIDVCWVGLREDKGKVEAVRRAATDRVRIISYLHAVIIQYGACLPP